MIGSCPTLVGIGCTLAGNAASSVAAGVARDLAVTVIHAVAGAADWLVSHLLTLITTTTRVDLAAPWFLERERAMVSVMALLILPLLLAGTISAIIRQDVRRLARTWVVALPVAAVVTLAAINLTQVALGAADAMTAVVARHQSLAGYADFTKVLEASAGSTFVIGVVALLVVLGALLVWMELVVRSAAMYVAVFFLPLALAGMVWPATSHMAKRLVEGLVALILSKFVIVATLTLGAGAVASMQGVDEVAAGTAILFLAAAAPFVLFRMVPVIEASAVAHLEGVSRRPGQALAGGASRAMSMAGPSAAVLSALRGAGAPAGGIGTRGVARAGGGGGPGTGVAVRAQRIPSARATYDPATGSPPPSDRPPASGSPLSPPTPSPAGSPSSGSGPSSSGSGSSTGYPPPLGGGHGDDGRP